MIIKKIYLSIGLFIAIFGMNNSVISMPAANDNIIPNASYLIYSGVNAKSPLPGIPCDSTGRHVTFYTFDGDPIVTQEHNARFPVMVGMLDPRAPKPQPVSCMIKHWHAVYLGKGMYKGSPGAFICFYDKNGNQIESYRYSKNNHTIHAFRIESSAAQTHAEYLFNESNPSSIDSRFPLDLRRIKKVEIEQNAISQRTGRRHCAKKCLK